MKLRAAIAFAPLVILFSLFASTGAQEAAPKALPVTPPAAQAKDVDSIDHIIAAAYDVISGPAGPRDWNRMRSLFCDGARLIPSWRDNKGNLKTRNMSPDDYSKVAPYPSVPKAFSKYRLPTAWSPGTTWPTSGALTNPATPKKKNPSLAVSTAFNYSMMARAGGF